MDAFDVRGGQPIAGDLPFTALAPRLGSSAGATGDFCTQSCRSAPEEGDLLAVRSAGAYGFVMNSNDNTRCRAAEVLADGSAAQALHRREARQELFAGESLLPD